MSFLALTRTAALVAAVSRLAVAQETPAQESFPLEKSSSTAAPQREEEKQEGEEDRADEVPSASPRAEVTHGEEEPEERGENRADEAPLSSPRAKAAHGEERPEGSDGSRAEAEKAPPASAPRAKEDRVRKGGPQGCREPSCPAPVISPRRKAKNSTYLELLGAGIFWTLNYERTFNDFMSLRIGAGTVPSLAYAFPVTLSYHGIGSFNHSLELGLGLTVFHYGIEFANPSTSVASLAFLGYRYQPSEGGFFFRGGLDVHFDDQAFRSIAAVFPWPYLGIGWTY